MDIKGNTILITGGNSGIGLGLAQAFHAAGNKVVIAGRRNEELQKAVAGFPGMDWLHVDMADAGSIQALAAEVIERHPRLNVLVNNAGIMRMENLQADPVELGGAESQVAINLLGPIRLSAALLPLLRKQPRATIINVSSGLAFVPLKMVPTYCATKAGIHAYSQALRSQLRETSVDVIEIAPPPVATNLMPLDENSPPTLPTASYVAAVMRIIEANPQVTEVLVEEVQMLRQAEATGNYQAVYAMLNN